MRMKVNRMRIEDVLKDSLSSVHESRVKEAMLYSLLAGGKRIRPNLLYAVLRGYGRDEAEGDSFAAAIEMIHTYSLIHDDLPAMDNDDLRRGRKTCHKQFDEATAILAGDGLLTQAFASAAASEVPSDIKGKCIAVLAEMAGPDGMVLGQDLDIREETGVTDWESLKTIHKYKTGCLLSAPLMIGALISGHGDDTEKWHEIGETIGLAFQIQDDILDVVLTAEEFGKSNSDDRNSKVTSVSLLGIEEAEKLMIRLYERGKELIRSVSGFQSDELVGMITDIQNRRK